MGTEHWWNDTGRREAKYWKESVCQWQFVCHKPKGNDLGLIPVICDDRPTTNRLNHSTVFQSLSGIMRYITFSYGPSPTTESEPDGSRPHIPFKLLACMSESPRELFLANFSPIMSYTFLTFFMYSKWPTYDSILDLITLVMLGKEQKPQVLRSLSNSISPCSCCFLLSLLLFPQYYFFRYL